MKRLLIIAFVLLVLGVAFTNCASGRKHQSSLRGLMLQDNTHLARNRAFYSRHNMKNRRDAYRKHRRIRR